MTGRAYGIASRELNAQIAEVAASLEAVEIEPTDTKIAVVLSYLSGQRITRGTVRNRRARMDPQGA
jgi:hypothetical protein